MSRGLSSQETTRVPDGAPIAQRRRDGMPAIVPPADIPLALLGASGLGLVAAGVGLVAEASTAATAPMAPRVVAVVHVAMLAFLSAGVLGAVHQFAPVVARQPLRSPWLARFTVVTFVAGAWGLPAGFASGNKTLLAAAGASAAVAVAAAAWNLSRPLAARDGGPPVVGLRWSVTGLVGTVAVGVTYVADRNADERWFGLVPHLVLAHAHLGLLGWLGLTYVAVAEKLWPMFLLAHRPGPSPGRWAIRLLPIGLAALVSGLALAWVWLATAGAVIVVAGLIAHVASFAGLVRHRRRSLDLLHGFVAVSALSLVVGTGLAFAAAFAPLSSQTRAQVTAAEIAALAGWIGLALVGHAHKVVPFITWGILRRRGVRTATDGRPLLFSHLYDRRVAVATFVAATVGVAATVSGLAGGNAGLVTLGGSSLAAAGALVVTNLAAGPLGLLLRARTRVPAPVAASQAQLPSSSKA